MAKTEAEVPEAAAAVLFEAKGHRKKENMVRVPWCLVGTLVSWVLRLGLTKVHPVICLWWSDFGTLRTTVIRDLSRSNLHAASSEGWT